MLSNNKYNQEKLLSYLNNVPLEQRNHITKNLDTFWEYLNGDNLDNHPLQDKVSLELILDPCLISIPGQTIAHTYDRATINDIKPDEKGHYLEPQTRKVFDPLTQVIENHSTKDSIEHHILNKVRKFCEQKNNNSAKALPVSSDHQENVQAVTPIIKKENVVDNHTQNKIENDKPIGPFEFENILASEQLARAALLDDIFIPRFTREQLITIKEKYKNLNLIILSNPALRFKLTTDDKMNFAFETIEYYGKQLKPEVTEYLLQNHLACNLPTINVKFLFFEYYNSSGFRYERNKNLIETIGLELLAERIKKPELFSDTEINTILKYNVITNYLINNIEKNLAIIQQFNQSQWIIFFKTAVEFLITSYSSIPEPKTIYNLLSNPLLKKAFYSLDENSLLELAKLPGETKLKALILSDNNLLKKFKTPTHILSLLNNIDHYSVIYAFKDPLPINEIMKKILSSIKIDEVPLNQFVDFVTLCFKFCLDQPTILSSIEQKLSTATFISTLNPDHLILLSTTYKRLTPLISSTIATNPDQFTLEQLILFKDKLSLSDEQKNIIQIKIQKLIKDQIKGQKLSVIEKIANQSLDHAIAAIEVFKFRLQYIAELDETEREHYDKLDRTIMYDILKKQPLAAEYLKQKYPILIKIFIPTQQANLHLIEKQVEAPTKTSGSNTKVSGFSLLAKKPSTPSKKEDEKTNKRWFQWKS